MRVDVRVHDRLLQRRVRLVAQARVVAIGCRASGRGRLGERRHAFYPCFHCLVYHMPEFEKLQARGGFGLLHAFHQDGRDHGQIATKPGIEAAARCRRHAENRQRRRDQSPTAGDRRLSARHRCPQAQRHRHDLRPARHPDHRPHAPLAGRGHARAFVPSRAERRLRRVDRRLPDAKAGHLPHGVGAGLPERPQRARPRHRQLLPDDPDQRLERARDRRPAAGRLRGDGPARHRQAASPRPRSACCTPRTSASASRAPSAPRCPAARAASTSTCRPSSSRRAIDAEAGKKTLIKVVDPAPKQIPAPDAVKRALDLLKGAKKPLIVLGKGAAYAQADADIKALVEKTRHPVPADVDGQGPAARHARAVRLGGALVRAARRRRGDADRRAPQLAALARQGQDLGRQGRTRTGAARSSSRSTSRRRRPTATCASTRRSSATSVRASPRCWHEHEGGSWAKPPAEWLSAVTEKKTGNVAKMAETLAKNPTPMNFHSALNVVRDIVKANPDAMLVNEGANALDFTRSIVDMYKPRKRIDVGTWGIMGVGMGYCVAAAVDHEAAGDRDRGRQRVRLLRHGGGDDLPLQPAGVRRDHEQQRRVQGHGRRPDRPRPGARRCSSRARATRS